MMKKKVTLKDIADHCDLAATTVSRILRGKSTYCSAAKIEMVKRIAREWDYRPNVGYNIMTGRDTNIAAVIFSQSRITQDDCCHNFYMQLAAALDERHFASYTAIMDGDLKSQLCKIRDLDERGCRNYIFIGSPAHYEEIFAYLERMKRSYVGYNCPHVPRFLMLDQTGMLMKFKDIASACGAVNYRFVSSLRNFESNILPRIPVKNREIFRRNLWEVPPTGLISGDSREWYFNSGKEIMRQVLTEAPEVDALAFPSDFHVFGANAVLRENGKSGKIRLFGMGNAAASKFVQIPFTTAAFDVGKGVEKLLEQLENRGSWEMWLSGSVVEYNISGE